MKQKAEMERRPAARAPLKLQQPAGSNVALLRITGERRNCEPAQVRIIFPGGDLEVVRATDGDASDYWVHIRVNHPKDGWDVPGETMYAQLSDARLDIHGKHTIDVDKGEFGHPDLYHLAVRVQPNWPKS